MTPALPKLGNGKSPLPDAPVQQIRRAMTNWNWKYGGAAQLTRFDALGICRTDRHRQQVVEWTLEHLPILVADDSDPDGAKIVPAASLDEAAQLRADYAAMIDGLIDTGDHIVALHWSEAPDREFTTLAIVDNGGVKFDPLMIQGVTTAEGMEEPDGHHTHCVWRRIGWLWQSDFEDMTRGEIKICLSADCNAQGEGPIRCRKSISHFMQLGSSDAVMSERVHEGNCCVAECAWAWAAGPVEAEIKIDINGAFKAEFSMTLTSHGAGEETLVDCCPKMPVALLDRPKPPREDYPPAVEKPTTVERPPRPTTVERPPRPTTVERPPAQPIPTPPPIAYPGGTTIIIVQPPYGGHGGYPAPTPYGYPPLPPPWGGQPGTPPTGGGGISTTPGTGGGGALTTDGDDREPHGCRVTAVVHNIAASQPIDPTNNWAFDFDLFGQRAWVTGRFDADGDFLITDNTLAEAFFANACRSSLNAQVGVVAYEYDNLTHNGGTRGSFQLLCTDHIQEDARTMPQFAVRGQRIRIKIRFVWGCSHG